MFGSQGSVGEVVVDSYACPVPVSRRRKKTGKSKAKAKSKAKSKAQASTRAVHPKTPPDRGDPPRPELARALALLTADRAQLDKRRASLAAAAAEALVADLVELALARPDLEFEDEVRVQLVARLQQWAEAPIEDLVTPEEFAEAAVAEALTAVRGALEQSTAEPDGWRAPWRVLTTLAGTVTYPLSATAADAIEGLRRLPGGRVLPRTPDGPKITGQVLWTRDAYGSRFGVTAPFSTPHVPDRWYLWDIDACGYQPFLVHSAYYPTSEQALAAWQAGVGPLAAGQTAFAPVDDRGLLTYLMYWEKGVVLSRGESASAAEYYRSRRLAIAAVESLRSRDPGYWVGVDAAAAATEFAAWLRARRAGQPEQADLDEQITELADSWRFKGPAALYQACSPHRVALTVLHLRDFYQDDFAEMLVALLPEWVEWLAERNNTPPHLAERCRPYALGEPHADVGSGDGMPNYRARVIE
jgi:hypothetical protein